MSALTAVIALAVLIVGASMYAGWAARGAANRYEIARAERDGYIAGERTAAHDLDDLRAENYDLEQRLAMRKSAVIELSEAS